MTRAPSKWFAAIAVGCCCLMLCGFTGKSPFVGGAGGIRGDGNSSHFPDGSGTWRGIKAADIADLPSDNETLINRMIAEAGTGDNTTIQAPRLGGTGQDSSAWDACYPDLVSGVWGCDDNDTRTQRLIGLVIGTNVLAPDGNGSSLSGVVKSESDPEVGAVNGIVKSDGAAAFSAATYADVVGLWTTCSGYLKDDGTCDTPAGGGDNETLINRLATALMTGGTVDALFKSFTTTKANNTASQQLLYGDNGTQTLGAGWMGPHDATARTFSYYVRMPTAEPTSGQVIAAGTPSDHVSTGSWVTPVTGTLGTSANVIPKASGTEGQTAQASGITEDGTNVLLGALNLVTTGTISGAIPMATDDSGNATITAAQQYGYFHWQGDAGTVILSGAAAGMSLCVYSTGANAVKIRPEASDKIVLNGTAMDAQEAIVSASAAGNFVCLLAKDAEYWYTLGTSGTWTQETP